MVGLVTFGVGTWREVMDMDFEDAVHTFYIHYVNRINECVSMDTAREKAKLRNTAL